MIKKGYGFTPRVADLAIDARCPGQKCSCIIRSSACSGDESPVSQATREFQLKAGGDADPFLFFKAGFRTAQIALLPAAQEDSSSISQTSR
jgi:hypothetical protein